MFRVCCSAYVCGADSEMKLFSWGRTRVRPLLFVRIGAQLGNNTNTRLGSRADWQPGWPPLRRGRFQRASDGGICAASFLGVQVVPPAVFTLNFLSFAGGASMLLCSELT